MQVRVTLECGGITEFSAMIDLPEISNLPDVLGLFVNQYRRAKPISPFLDDDVVLRFNRHPGDRPLRKASTDRQEPPGGCVF